MMDYDLQRCTKHCAKTGRELSPGEVVYSVLVQQGSNLIRQDYSPEGWQGPPSESIAWWKSQLPAVEAKKPQWAPNDVMLELFEQLVSQPDKQDMRYVLALLLVRRRVMRLEETLGEATPDEVLVLYCPRKETEYRVPAMMPDEARADEIQNELAQLLSAGSQ